MTGDARHEWKHELPPDGVEYDERHIARLNAQLKGVEFVDDGERWRVLKVSFDAEHEEPVCFYFDAKLGDKGTVDDCCLLYTSPSPRDLSTSRMPSSA